MLIKKVYENKNNFSYCVSPFLYLKVDKEICSNNYKEILNMKIDLFKSLENVYQMFLIKNGNDYLFGSLPLKNKTSEVKEKNMNYDNNNNRTYRKLYDNEDDIWKWKFVLKNEDENYKNVITWCKNNTLLISSNKKLMYLVKFWKELNIFGLPISVNKLKEFLQ